MGEGERGERERKDGWSFPVKPSSDRFPSDQLIICGASVHGLHSILKIQGWDHTTHISIFPVLEWPEGIKEAGMLFPKCQTGDESIFFTHSLLLYYCCQSWEKLMKHLKGTLMLKSSTSFWENWSLLQRNSCSSCFFGWPPVMLCASPQRVLFIFKHSFDCLLILGLRHSPSQACDGRLGHSSWAL